MENFCSAWVSNLEFRDDNMKKNISLIFRSMRLVAVGGEGGGKQEEFNKKTECEQKFSTVIVKGKTRDVYN